MQNEMDSTRVRDMREVAREARDMAQNLEALGALEVAGLYRDIAQRADAVARRERAPLRLKVLDSVEAVRGDMQRLRLVTDPPKRPAWRRWLGGLAACLGIVSCAGVPARSERPAIEAYGGAFQPTSKGKNDIADVGAVPIVGIGGSYDSGEWFLEGGKVSARDVNAGDLGIFDLDAALVRMGAGLRLGTGSALGMDWSLGLGAAVTVVHGDADAGTLHADVDESGAGAYCALVGARGPLRLRVTWLSGPKLDVNGDELELGGLQVSLGVGF